MQTMYQTRTSQAPSKAPFALSLSVLFNPAFLQQYAVEESVTGFFARGGHDVRGWADIQRLTKAELDAHVRQYSSFPSWLDMLDAATLFFFADMYRCLMKS